MEQLLVLLKKIHAQFNLNKISEYINRHLFEMLIFLYFSLKQFKMKKLLLTLSIAISFTTFSFAQSTILGAETFSINLPNGYTRTVGTNDLASVQWENSEKETYGYIIFENLDELDLVEFDRDINKYADLSVNDFSDLNKYKLIETKKFKTKSGKETVQKQISYYNDELDATIQLQINIFMTKNFIYKMISFGEKEIFKKSDKDLDYIVNNIQLP